MIEFNCSNCNRAFKVADTYAGKSVRCPDCKTVIRVPAETPEEEPEPPRKPSRVVREEDAPPRKVRRLSEPEEDTPSRRRRRDEVDERDDDTPSRRRRRDEDDERDDYNPRRRPDEDYDRDEDTPRRRRRDEDDDDRPRKKRKKKVQSSNAQLFLGMALGLFGVYVILGILGFMFKGGAIAMLVVGAVPMIIGTLWIRHIARQEGDFHYYACMYVPFYETFFALSRWGETWTACLTCWIGRIFVITAGIFLLVHGLYDKDGGSSPRRWVAAATAAESDAQCVNLLRARDATEARTWLAVPNRRIQAVMVGRLALRPAVDGLYQQGAVRVTFAEMVSDEDTDDPMHLIVEMPIEKEKRQAVVNFVNTQLLEAGDDRQSDRGQRYLLVLTN